MIINGIINMLKNLKFIIHWLNRCDNNLIVATGAIIYFTSGAGKAV